MRIPTEVLLSNSCEATSSELALMNLREEWHSDVDLCDKFISLQGRVNLDASGRNEIPSTFELIKNLWGEVKQPKLVIDCGRRLATVSSWLCEIEGQIEMKILPQLQTAWKGSGSLEIVEECVYKMNEISEDLEHMKRSGILAENHLQSVKHLLRACWFGVREFLLKSSIKNESDASCYYLLVDNFLRHADSLGFQDCGLEAMHSRLCSKFLLRGLSHVYKSSICDGSMFCSTYRPLRSLFLPSWLTERYRLMKCRPPIALTRHSLPDISTETRLPMVSSAETALHTPQCAVLQSRQWMSQPELQLEQTLPRKSMIDSFSVLEEETEVNSPHSAKMNTSQFSFSRLPSEETKFTEMVALNCQQDVNSLASKHKSPSQETENVVESSTVSIDST